MNLPELVTCIKQSIYKHKEALNDIENSSNKHELCAAINNYTGLAFDWDVYCNLLRSPLLYYCTSVDEVLSFPDESGVLTLSDNELRMVETRSVQPHAIARHLAYSSPSCYRIQECRVFGPYGLVFNQAGRLVVDIVDKQLLPVLFSRTLKLYGFVAILKELLYSLIELSPDSNYEQCFHLFASNINLNSGTPQYGHFMLETLPKLRHYFELLRITPYISMTPLSAPFSEIWVSDLLRLALQTDTQTYSVGGIGAKVSSLYLVPNRSADARHYCVDPYGRKWLSKHLRNRILTGTFFAGIPVYRKIYMSRVTSSGVSHIRTFKDNVSVESSFADMGYHTLYLQKHTVLYEAQLVYACRTLVSMFGSGLSKMLFMRSPNRIIELYTTKEKDYFPFFLLAKELEIPYLFQPCDIDHNEFWLPPEDMSVFDDVNPNHPGSSLDSLKCAL